MRIGELLITERLLTQDGLREGLEAQVVQGGRLGTNLVELGLIKEADLARCLGRLHQVGFASGDMKPDPRALSLVPQRTADAKDVLPMRVDATKLTLAVVNPHDIGTFDAIAFKTGKRVIPVLIPEFRMNQLLRRHYNSFRPVRAIDMEIARPARPKQAPASAKQQAEDLMSEEEFQSLYAKVLAGSQPEGAEDEESIEGIEVVDEPPAPVEAPPSVQARAASIPRAPAPEPEEASEPLEPSTRPLEDDASLTAIAFAEAQSALAQSEDREEIARTVLRFAIGKWERALVLSVQGNMVLGWRGAGKGIVAEAVKRIAVVLRGQSTFKLVRDTRSHFIGPVRRDAGSGIFYKALGGNFPKTAVFLPLLVRGKVVHILYVDSGPDRLTPPDIGELLILAQSVGRSYEALLRRRMSH